MGIEKTAPGIPTRVLGSTGVELSIIGVGGYHIARAAGDEIAVEIVRTAIDNGVNLMDNAWCYHQGRSEALMGRALRDGYRERVFLMTKNHGRDDETYRTQLEQSLRRLDTDQIDLVQFHDITNQAEVESIFTRGAIEAAVKARDEGKIRFIGFTGHTDPGIHLAMLQQDFAWDTVQLPINLLDAHYRSFAAQVVPLLQQRGVGIIGMKSLSGGRIMQAGVTPREAIGYALSQPVDTLVCGIDSIEVLQQDLAIARQWRPMPREEQTVLLERVRPVAVTGQYEYYKPA